MTRESPFFTQLEQLFAASQQLCDTGPQIPSEHQTERSLCANGCFQRPRIPREMPQRGILQEGIGLFAVTEAWVIVMFQH